MFIFYWKIKLNYFGDRINSFCSNKKIGNLLKATDVFMHYLNFEGVKVCLSPATIWRKVAVFKLLN